ncbi:MAG: hypothetical protein K0R27_5371 [Xanthobacteraceae bacterium]|jgi:predicted alpha/beta superfamily hydrolase|nr:hypothetical protein [Xanthobacteraceae bacterium]
MIARALWEGLKSIGFGRRRRALQARAAVREDDVLTAAGAAYVMKDVQPFVARGPSGDYAIFVTLPSAPPPPAGYPVLYMLDGNAFVGGAAEALQLQSRFWRQSQVEPALVVAVGYPGDALFDMGRRAYDFLPSHSSGKLSERFMQGAPWHQPGGADAFLDFLTGPLRDAIARRYPVDPARQVLSGHSFGGFFTLYALLTRPRAFRRYAALSPSLWWDEGRLPRDAQHLIAALPADLQADLLFAVAEDETPDRPHISARMLADAADLAARLERDGPAGLAVRHVVLAGENHQSVPPTVFSRVLRFASAPLSSGPDSKKEG